MSDLAQSILEPLSTLIMDILRMETCNEVSPLAGPSTTITLRAILIVRYLRSACIWAAMDKQFGLLLSKPGVVL